eukprot:Awhi_evm1s13023
MPPKKNRKREAALKRLETQSRGNSNVGQFAGKRLKESLPPDLPSQRSKRTFYDPDPS